MGRVAVRREVMVARMKAVAENEQEQKSAEQELAQLLELQSKLEEKGLPQVVKQ